METILHPTHQIPWNKGRLTGQKPPLRLNEIWAIRTRLQFTSNVRELAMFNLAIDSKLRACDLTRLRVQDICVGSQVSTRATVMQQKTQRPVQCEITHQTRESVKCWIRARGLNLCDFLFPSRLHSSPHLSQASISSAPSSFATGATLGVHCGDYMFRQARRTRISSISRFPE
jgi:hypothetical protein